MINKALLNPWVRFKLNELLELGRRSGLAPHVSSAVRDVGDQTRLWQQCQAGAGVRGFPVKDPLCSQHVWGMAFDMVAGTEKVIMAEPLPIPGGTGIPSVTRDLLCGLFGEFPLCATGVSVQDQRNNQLALGLIADSIGLVTNRSDSVHFSAFPSSVWDPHMRSEFGLACTTCHHPGGPPF